MSIIESTRLLKAILFLSIALLTSCFRFEEASRKITINGIPCVLKANGNKTTSISGIGGSCMVIPLPIPGDVSRQ